MKGLELNCNWIQNRNGNHNCNLMKKVNKFQQTWR